MSGLSGVGEGMFGCGPRLEEMGGGWAGETIGAGGGRNGWGLKDQVRGGRLVATCITVM